jgi:hypothetical protein
MTWLPSQIKGTVSRDFLLRFFHGPSSPKPLKLSIGSFGIFSKIFEDIRHSRCATSINDTSGKFTTGINNTGGKFATGGNNGNNIRLLTP